MPFLTLKIWAPLKIIELMWSMKRASLSMMKILMTMTMMEKVVPPTKIWSCWNLTRNWVEFQVTSTSRGNRHRQIKTKNSSFYPKFRDLMAKFLLLTDNTIDRYKGGVREINTAQILIKWGKFKTGKKAIKIVQSTRQQQTLSNHVFQIIVIITISSF